MRYRWATTTLITAVMSLSGCGNPISSVSNGIEVGDKALTPDQIKNYSKEYNTLLLHAPQQAKECLLDDRAVHGLLADRASETRPFYERLEQLKRIGNNNPSFYPALNSEAEAVITKINDIQSNYDINTNVMARSGAKDCQKAFDNIKRSFFAISEHIGKVDQIGLKRITYCLNALGALANQYEGRYTAPGKDASSEISDCFTIVDGNKVVWTNVE